MVIARDIGDGLKCNVESDFNEGVGRMWVQKKIENRAGGIVGGLAKKEP